MDDFSFLNPIASAEFNILISEKSLLNRPMHKMIWEDINKMD
jgi:hypothetical protein